MLFGEGMNSGWNRGFVPRRASNQWGIEAKASIGISLSRFDAKSPCDAVLLTLRLSSVKLPSIEMLSYRSRVRSCQGVNVAQERTITSISTRRCRLPRCLLSADSGTFQLRGKICSIPSADWSGTCSGSKAASVARSVCLLQPFAKGRFGSKAAGCD